MQSEKINMKNLEQSSTHINRILNGMKIIYGYLAFNMLNEPDDTRNPPKIARTHEVQKVTRSLNEDCITCRGVRKTMIRKYLDAPHCLYHTTQLPNVITFLVNVKS